MFYRIETDGKRQPVQLQNFYSGPQPSACWIIGGGVSLGELPVKLIQESRIPKFSMNLAGTGLICPDFWTSYDPTARFHRSVYLSPAVTKFIHRSRAMDLVPESTFKVCDCPATLFFDRSRENSFEKFLESRVPAVPDWQDSFLQAIQIAYQLGFRRLYLAGCELFIAPTVAQIQLAQRSQVDYSKRELLKNFIQRCLDAGVCKNALSALNGGAQYHFDESKSLDATIQTDFHYFRVSQYLRLARKALATAGLEIISVTPQSRLNDYFNYQSVQDVVESVRTEFGDHSAERTRGLYTEQLDRTPAAIGPMRDFQPHFAGEADRPALEKPRRPQVIDLPEVPVYLNENPQ